MVTRSRELENVYSNAVPGLSAERNISWPVRSKTKLANGLEVVLAASHSIPKFHGELFFRSGNAAAKTGL